MRKFLLILLLLAGCVGAAWLGSWLPTNTARQVPALAVTALPVGGDFTLVDHQGKTRTRQDFAGKYLIVYFGYTFCPDICPMGLHNISDALYQLEKLGRRRLVEQLQPLFITIDPDRDTVGVLPTFIEQFHPKFLALTGTTAAINQVMQAYHVYGTKVPHDGTNYLMDHSSIVYVMDPQGRCVDHFTHETPPEEIVLHLRQIVC